MYFSGLFVRPKPFTFFEPARQRKKKSDQRVRVIRRVRGRRGIRNGRIKGRVSASSRSGIEERIGKRRNHGSQLEGRFPAHQFILLFREAGADLQEAIAFLAHPKEGVSEVPLPSKGRLHVPAGLVLPGVGLLQPMLGPGCQTLSPLG
jgi:hypothetical protein